MAVVWAETENYDSHDTTVVKVVCVFCNGAIRKRKSPNDYRSQPFHFPSNRLSVSEVEYLISAHF